MNNERHESEPTDALSNNHEQRNDSFEINSLETLVHYLGAVALNAPAALAKLWKIL